MLTFAQINIEGSIQSELQSPGFPAVLNYLRVRGIPDSLIDDLGIKILPAAELITRARGGPIVDDRLAVVIPHFGVGGDYIDWWSARLIDTGLRPIPISFANLVPDKRGKMFCPPNEAPHGYLPPILDWTRIEDGSTIYIHESAIKAINGARLGRWSVGLNGVWGWGSRKHGMALVQELKDLPWKVRGLKPVIVFDSNAADNWDVQNAIGRLASKILEICGVRARHLLVPMADGKHQGFDDFCMRVGDDQSVEFLDNLEGAAEVEIAGVELLKLQLNDEVCIVRSLGRIAEQRTGTLMTRSTFTDVNYAHYTAMVPHKEEEKQVNVPRLWLADPRRVEVDALTYMPGADKIAGGSLNLWRGMGLDPADGPVGRWMELLERNIPDPDLRKWVLQWMAYPLQNLGSKLTTFIHLYGPPGSGKQAVLRPLMLIYGAPNAIVIGKEQIESDFNSIYANKQFINIDEIHGGNSAGALTITNRIKRIVTSETLPINTKGQPEYEVPNCAQVVTTSNYSDSIRLDDDDRRCAVVRFGERGHGYDKHFWEGYFKWVDSEGAAAVYAYLLGMDLSDFDPTGWAPMTEDKTEITRATRRVDEQWVGLLWQDPSLVLPPKESSWVLIDTNQLSQYAFAEDLGGATSGKKNSLGIRMHSEGFKKTKYVKVGGKSVQFWIINNRDEQWEDVEKIKWQLKRQGYPLHSQPDKGKV